MNIGAERRQQEAGPLRDREGGVPASTSGGRRRSGRIQRLRQRPSSLAMFAVLTLVSFVMLYPFGFMILNSFRSQTQYMTGSGFSTASWGALFTALPVGVELLNSTLLCVAAIAIILIVSSLAGFAFAKLQFQRQGFVFLAIIGSMMVPLQSIIIPEYTNLASIHLINNYLSPMLVYAALGTPFATFLMTVFFRGLPDELVEAALCDGLGYFGVFWRIAVGRKIRERNTRHPQTCSCRTAAIPSGINTAIGMAIAKRALFSMTRQKVALSNKPV